MTSTAMPSSWKEFIQENEHTLIQIAPQVDQVEAVSDFLVKSGYSQPAQAIGGSFNDLTGMDGFPGPGPTRTMLQRVFTGLESHAEAARVVRASSASANATMQQQADQMANTAAVQQLQECAMQWMGNETSALALAHSMSGIQAGDSLAKALKDAGMETMPDHVRPPMEAWQLARAAVKGAKGGLGFSYFDLTRFLPNWLPPDAVGAQSTYDQQLEASGSSSLELLGKLNKAIDRASGHKLFFRRIHHWVMAFTMWAVMAIAEKTFSWVAYYCHLDTTMRLSEQGVPTLGAKQGHAVALIYEDLRRREWARRCRQADPTLADVKMLEKEAGEISKPLLEAARTRVQATLNAAGMQGSTTQQPNNNGLESLMAKSDAAMDALGKRHQESLRALARAQEEAYSKATSLVNGGETSRERHSRQFYERLDNRRQAGGGGGYRNDDDEDYVIQRRNPKGGRGGKGGGGRWDRDGHGKGKSGGGGGKSRGKGKRRYQ